MKKSKRSIFKSFILTVAFFFATLGAINAQPSGDGDSGGPTDAPGTPIDSGLSLLVAGGIVYGVSQINKIKKKI
jgi:hypothetical protein